MLEAAKEKWDATAIYWIEINWIILPKHEWGFGQLGFPDGSGGKESTHNEGDVGSIPGFGRSPGEGKGYPLQYSGLENFMDCTVHGVTKSQTWLSDFHMFTALDRKEIKPVNPKGNQPWMFTGRTDAEAPILWPRDVKSQLIGKDPDAGKDWGQEEKRATEHEMVGWHHQLSGCEFEQTLGKSEGQGNQACCHP